MKHLRPYQHKAVLECWEALRKNDEPVLLMASVGAGKSLMLSHILLSMQQAGKKSLCLVNNAELVRNNFETCINYAGKASIYCAALKIKNYDESIIFATPQSIINAIDKKEPISDIIFNIIMVDEAHAINYLNEQSSFMRILRHYKYQYPAMRVLGATGTNFRFKGASIVGKDCLFQSQVGNISTESLIEDGYLIKPTFEIDEKLVIDFSKVKIKSNGQFDAKQLEEVISANARLTELICRQIIHIMNQQARQGVFIFATTKKHALEIMSHLPADESVLILGETPQHERTEILDKARKGSIRYLVNIAIISVGVDVPAFDTIAYLRPTESLVLLVQTMGRGLRLCQKTNKKEALVLDFSGNIERHQDWDNPVLLDALKQTVNKDKPLVILCPACQEFNTEHARRCIGVTNDKRCDYYFEFKRCPNTECEVKNDIAARHCRSCNTEIIDPNDKLHLQIKDNLMELKVLESQYSISGTQRGFRVSVQYKCSDESGRTGTVFEHYSPINTNSLRVFYGKFVKQHCPDSSKWYRHLQNKNKVEEMLRTVDTPVKLLVSSNHDRLLIKRKVF